jgi:conjugative relaxase-like TrwC/TraI family protein
MIFVNHMKSAKAAKDYYTQHIAPGDGRYYANDAAEMKGLWHGRAAGMMNLSGEVTQEQFFRLCENTNPDTGEKLTPRTKDDRRVLTDFTFDAPKAVTLALELGGDERVLLAFRESVRETMAEIEDSVGTRVRKKGADTDRITGNMVWAEHVHRTTRPVDGSPDPQLHCHATVFNATYDENEGRWKAIQLGEIVRDKGYYQAAFHSRLAGKLKSLGYGIEKDGNSFTLAGISRELVEDFSRRSAVINEEAKRHGITDAKQKGTLGRKTREKKNEQPLSMVALRDAWRQRVSQKALLALETARSGGASGDAPITPEQAKEYALEHSFQNTSTVSEKRLKAEALTYSVGSVLPEDVADIAQHREVIAETRGGQRMTTTKTVLRHEIAMLQFAKDGQRKFKPLVDTKAQTGELAGLSDQQRKAAVHILGSRDQVVGVRGAAGTGKTHMLQTVNAVITAVEKGEGDYSHVFAFAQSATASRGELRKVGFRDAQTLATLFRNEKMQASLHKQVILVDEAGQVSTNDMRKLFDIAGKQQARVILVGDYRQHSSVEAGDAFRLIEKEGGVRYAELTEIRRQREPGYKKAVEAIAEGTGKAAQKGFDALDRMGNVIEATGEERHRLLVGDYLKAQEDGASALIIAPTHSEGQKLTQELRAALKERGAVGTQERQFTEWRTTNWTEAQKGDARNYAPGMVVEFREAIPGTRHQRNGVRTTAGGFSKGEAAVVVGSEDGAVRLLRKDGTQGLLSIEHSDRINAYRPREIAIAKGDRIRITKNGEAKIEGQTKGAALNNGDIFTVEGFTRDGDIRLDKAKYLPKNWAHFTLGYVDTSYASQGKTVDRVFIAAGNQSIPATNQQQWYVSASRGRDQAKLYVESKEDVRDAIARTGQRLSAVELTNTRMKDSWRVRFYTSLERNRIAKFLRERANAVAESWNQRRRGGLGYA